MIGSPVGDIEHSPRISHLFQLFDHAAQGTLPPTSAYSGLPLGTPRQTNSFGAPLRYPAAASAGISTASGAQISPRTDASGSRTSGDNPSPAGSKASGGRPPSSTHSRTVKTEHDDIIEIPNQQQTLYNDEPLGVTPVFADTPAWLTEATTAAIPMYHRKSSDGATLRLMVEALSNHNGTRFEESQDPLNTTPRRESAKETQTNGGPVQQSPFGTLLVPPQTDPSGDITRSRRSSSVTPHWTQTPRLLVVEDDVVYRQLSSKFLEKFGCVTETVDDAQGAIEKMNRTKYDLALMDIFFGPSMDG